jgi:hypothetical protein
VAFAAAVVVEIAVLEVVVESELWALTERAAKMLEIMILENSILTNFIGLKYRNK